MTPHGDFYVFGYLPANTRNKQNTVKVWASSEEQAREKAHKLAAKRAQRRGVEPPHTFRLHWTSR